MIKTFANYVVGIALLGSVLSMSVQADTSSDTSYFLSVGQLKNEAKVKGFLNWINEAVKKHEKIGIVVGDNGKGERFQKVPGAVIFVDEGIEKIQNEDCFAFCGEWNDFVRFAGENSDIKNALMGRVNWVFDDWNILSSYRPFLDKPDFELLDEDKNEFNRCVAARERGRSALRSSLEFLSTILTSEGRIFTMTEYFTKVKYDIFCEKFTPMLCAKGILAEPVRIFDLEDTDFETVNADDILLLEKGYDVYKHVGRLKRYKKVLDTSNWKKEEIDAIDKFFDKKSTGEEKFGLRCFVFKKK